MRRDLGVGIIGRIIFKWMLEKYDVTRYGSFAVSCEHGNELRGYINGNNSINV